MRGPSLENFLLSRVLGFSVFGFRLLGLLKAIYKGFFRVSIRVLYDKVSLWKPCGPSLRLGDVSLDVYCLGFRV